MSPSEVDHKPSVLVFGTYDPRNPRTHVICDAMRELSWRVDHCQICLLPATAKKLAVFRGRGTLAAIMAAATVYPRLVWRALNKIPFDYLMITTGGFGDAVFGWITSRIAGARMIFDPLYGLYETVVEDRGLIAPGHLVAKALRIFEKFCFRLADIIFVDTVEHREYFAREFGVSRRRMRVVPVGAREKDFVPVSDSPQTTRPKTMEVLFYGSMIPLHGADTIIRAAHLLSDEPVHFTIIGQGQTSEQVQALAKELRCPNITFIPEIPFGTIPEQVATANICLGIFGTTEKCKRVVPNKVYECMAMGKPVITGNTPAIRRWFDPGKHLLTVPCGDGPALAKAIRKLSRNDALRDSLGRRGRERFVEQFSIRAITMRLEPLEDLHSEKKLGSISALPSSQAVCAAATP